MCGEMSRRVLIALASFWGAGVLALLVVSDPGSMTHARTYWTFFILATYGLLFGPFAFVVGAHGLIFGSRSEAPPFVWVWMALAFIGYFGLFAGAVGLKSRKLRAACLLVEAVCALVAAKGLCYCI